MTLSRKAGLVLGFILLAAGGLAAPAAAQPVADTGPVTLSAEAEADDNLQWAAAVVVINELPNQGDFTVKMFGAAGGDPAMNGLYTYLAFYQGPGSEWRIFKLGDFLSYRVLSSTRGRVLLEVSESVMNQQTTEISSRRRRLLVTWTFGANEDAPTAVRVATAPQGASPRR